MTGASFETLDTEVTGPRVTSGCGVGCDRPQRHHTTLQMFLPPSTAGARIITPIPDGCAPLPGSAAAEAPWVPGGVFRPHPARVSPEGSTIIHILGAVTTMPHHPSREQGWVRSPARRRGLRLVRFEHKHDSCDGPDPACREGV